MMFVAIRWTTPSGERCTRPSTSISRAAITGRRSRSNWRAQSTQLVTPVSSSMVMKMALPLPGRWRTSTSPAVRVKRPSARRDVSAQVLAPSRAKSGRSSAIGCAFSDRRRVW